MIIKFTLQKIVEIIMGKRCEKCKYNNGLLCENIKRTDCQTRIFPVGFEKKEGAET